MSETIDELTINWSDEEGRHIRKELKKEVLTKGSWTTIMYLYQDMDRKSGEYGAPKISIRRYKKTGGVYREQSKFNVSNAKQAHQMMDIFKKWFPEDPREK